MSNLIQTADTGDGVRVLTLNNPPVNALSYALCGELVPLIAAAAADASVTTVIFTGANNTFSAGADVNDFAIRPTADTKTVRDAIEAVERSDKTFVAAIDGNALGGGLELALACDYRVAAAKSRVGLPEIKLGLLPGAGGTQRLPRLIGANEALQLMLKGELVKAADALAKGILDEVVDGDPVEAAKAYAGKPKRRLSQRKAELGVANLGLFATPFVVAQAHMMVPPEENGGFAAHKLIDAVQAAIELPFERGWARELRLFMELVQSAPSAALRHVFFAERELSKVPGLPKTEPLPIKKAGVIGAGTMGTGIAIVFAEAGIPVTVVETKDEAIEKARETVFGMFKYQVEKGRLSARRRLETGQLDLLRIRLLRVERRRRRRRSCVRIDAREERDLRKARRGHQARLHPRFEYLDARYRRDRGGDEAPRQGPRAAFLRPGQHHEAARNRAREGNLAADADHRHRARQNAA